MTGSTWEWLRSPPPLVFVSFKIFFSIKEKIKSFNFYLSQSKGIYRIYSVLSKKKKRRLLLAAGKILIIACPPG